MPPLSKNVWGILLFTYRYISELCKILSKDDSFLTHLDTQSVGFHLSYGQSLCKVSKRSSKKLSLYCTQKISLGIGPNL